MMTVTRDGDLAWEKRMGFDRHGGAQRAADALGVSTETIRRLRTGAASYDRALALALSAIALGVPPWPVADEDFVGDSDRPRRMRAAQATPRR